MGKKMKYITFNHYTTEAAADIIIEYGVIKQSGSNGGPDAQLGPGVYGTKIPPSAGKEAIAKNNWAESWWHKKRRGCVDYVFRIRLPRNTVRERHFDDRHIFVHPGNLVLNYYKWKCLDVW